MGGRGASSGGRGSNGGRGSGRAPNGYRTTGRVGGISVIRSSRGNATTGLPTRAKANAKYFGTDRKGKVNQLRLYDKQGNVKKDIDWGHPFIESGKKYPAGTVHSHGWSNGSRSRTHSILKPDEVKKFKPSIEKATKGEDIKWQ